MRAVHWLWLTACPFLLACSEPPAPHEGVATPVRVVQPVVSAEQGLLLSGEVRAERELPLAFAVSGQLAERLVNAGASVQQGQSLARLDDQDFARALLAEQAALDAAHAAEANAELELARVERLREAQLASVAQRDAARLAFTQAQRAREAQRARMEIARKAAQDSVLRAPADGVIMSLAVEPQQVVNRGQAVGLFAYDGPRDIEVLLPPTLVGAGGSLGAGGASTANLITSDGSEYPLTLRETAGALSESARTLRARYQLQQPLDLPLRSVVQVRVQAAASSSWVVPLSALDGRCSTTTACPSGAQIWQVQNGQAQPLPVQIERVDGEYAYVSGALSAEQAIIAVGTHLLTPGQAVQVLPR